MASSAYITKVEMPTLRGPPDPALALVAGFMMELFKQEVPDQVPVEIQVVRPRPGLAAKIAVHRTSTMWDPIGPCVRPYTAARARQHRHRRATGERSRRLWWRTPAHSSWSMRPGDSHESSVDGAPRSTSVVDEKISRDRDPPQPRTSTCSILGWRINVPCRRGVSIKAKLRSDSVPQALHSTSSTSKRSPNRIAREHVPIVRGVTIASFNKDTVNELRTRRRTLLDDGHRTAKVSQDLKDNGLSAKS